MDFKIPRFDPISNATDDKLGFVNGAERLAGIFNRMETPNVFGIYGVWGSGKTSLMNLTKQYIDKEYANKIATAWFDPWKYEYQKDVPIVFPLLYTIQEELNASSLNKWIKQKLKYLFTHILALKDLPVEAATGSDDDSSLRIERASKAVFTEYENWVENMDKFKKEFTQKLSESLTQNKKQKLYIFIDDMDRCLQENVINLLEVLKNYLSVDNSLFIIGMDRRVIIDHINQKYFGKSYGEEYLNKIIPISISLPEKNPLEIIQQTLRNLGKDILSHEEVEIIGNYLHRYCRDNRRLMNIVFHKFIMAFSYIDMENLQKELNQAQPDNFKGMKQCNIALLRWCLIQELNPQMFYRYNWIQIYKDRLEHKDETENYIAHVAMGWEKAGGGYEALTPTINTGVATILNDYINDGLFHNEGNKSK